ncbi:MAG: multidrug effflux MFS transporter [Pseudorhodobacter sp.]
MAEKRLSQPEFIALVAMLFATIAFTIDAMLPALPDIAAELTPDNPNQAQLILTSFVLGMGGGTLIVGPLSDRFGRKGVIVLSSLLYCIAGLLAWVAPTLETLLVARILQGVGAAGPRVVSLAMVRDLYKGREMARIMSFAMMIFTLFPAVAPLLGSLFIQSFGWRSIFIVFLLFCLVVTVWLIIRQPETLAIERRRTLDFPSLWGAFSEVMTTRIVLVSILIQSMILGALFATLSSIQPIFDATFGRADSFPLWFALIALIAGTSSILNATLVGRWGMRRLVVLALLCQIALSAFMAVMNEFALWPEPLIFPAFLIWLTGVFGMMGLTMGNLNALALEPLGHIAGMASSVIGALATILAVLIAAPLGLAFDGTTLPLMIGVAVLTGLAFLLMRLIPGAGVPATP